MGFFGGISHGFSCELRFKANPSRQSMRQAELSKLKSSLGKRGSYGSYSKLLFKTGNDRQESNR